jgi:FADH2 O2-dependent halogenase
MRFDNDLMIAGFVLDLDEHPPDLALSPKQEWDGWMARYPSLAEQFASSRRILPAEGLRRTGRLQRMTQAAAGDNWALLPYTFGFIDALHSTGIAQTMCAIERLAFAFTEHWGRASLAEELKRYDEALIAEITLIDELVHGCYLSRRSFPRFAAWTMLYFAATTTYERRRQAGALRPGAAFLGADDPAWRQIVRSAGRRLQSDLTASDSSEEDFTCYVADLIAPYNVVGLCDPRAANMYRHTAVVKG